jgi:superoxide dismutase, Fe-Mn family
MRYHMTPINTRPWLLNGLSLRLIESHYENHYGGALRRLNAITEQLESLDFDKTPGHVVNSLKREELIALNSTLLHELYFASMAFGDGRPTPMLARALTRDFGSVDRWRSEFVAMAKGLAGGSGWVLLVYVPRDRRLINQYAGDHGQTTAGGIPILALDMYEHAYHIDFGANATAYIDTFRRNINWVSTEARYEDASKVEGPRPLVQKEFGDLPGVGAAEVKAMLDSRTPVQIHRCSAEVLHFPPAGHHGSCGLARSRAHSRLDPGPLEIRPGRGVLRLRISRGMQDGHRAPRGRIRREVHERRPLGVESNRRPPKAVHVTVYHDFSLTGRKERTLA